MFTDPEHQRAKGNLKYFEFQLEKQRKDAEEETTKEKEEQEEPDITEKKKKSQTKSTFQLIPERKKYEMLCRGEGIKMVRKGKKEENHLMLRRLVCSHSDSAVSR